MENEKKKFTQEEIADRIAKSKALAAKRFERVEIPEGVKISYYDNDASLSDQRICIAQKYDPTTGVVTFGFSMNKPPKITWDKDKQVFKVLTNTGDVFSRRVGRNVALRNMIYKTKVLKDEFPNAACLRQIITICAEQPNLRRNLRLTAGAWYEILCGEQKRQDELRTIVSNGSAALERIGKLPAPTSDLTNATVKTGQVLLFGVTVGVVSGIIRALFGL